MFSRSSLSRRVHVHMQLHRSKNNDALGRSLAGSDACSCWVCNYEWTLNFRLYLHHSRLLRLNSGYECLEYLNDWNRPWHSIRRRHHIILCVCVYMREVSLTSSGLSRLGWLLLVFRTLQHALSNLYRHIRQRNLGAHRCREESSL
jgi:hypothetical protein